MIIYDVWVNWGRWLARCPRCGTPNDIQPDQKVFVCPVCYPDTKAWAIRMDPDGLGRPVPDTATQVNALTRAANEGQVYEIGWPENRQEIDDALRMRPTPAMNWTPDTTVDDLLVENKSMGIS